LVWLRRSYTLGGFAKMSAGSRRPRVGGWVEVVSGPHAGVIFQRMPEYDDAYCSGHFCLEWQELLDYAGSDGVRSYSPTRPTVVRWPMDIPPSTVSVLPGQARRGRPALETEGLLANLTNDGGDDAGTTTTCIRADRHEVAAAPAAVTGEPHPLSERRELDFVSG
jgi:hypothetical protein